MIVGDRLSFWECHERCPPILWFKITMKLCGPSSASQGLGCGRAGAPGSGSLLRLPSGRRQAVSSEGLTGAGPAPRTTPCQGCWPEASLLPHRPVHRRRGVLTTDTERPPWPVTPEHGSSAMSLRPHQHPVVTQAIHSTWAGGMSTGRGGQGASRPHSASVGLAVSAPHAAAFLLGRGPALPSVFPGIAVRGGLPFPGKAQRPLCWPGARGEPRPAWLGPGRLRVLDSLLRLHSHRRVLRLPRP